VALPHSGYYVMRSDWTPKADYVCFDCGEQAAGMRPDGIPNAMHGHADCLSVIVWLQGRRVLVDSGLYAYNCGGEWEAHFRETAAHNTARVDGRDQARHLGKMNWSHSYRAKLEGWQADPDLGWVVASHDGYARGPHGVTHRRALLLRHGRYLAIWDEFVGEGRHELEVNFQFAPGSLVEQGPDAVIFDGSHPVHWVSALDWRPTLVEGGQSPADGWIAPSLGVKQPAPRLRLQSVMDGGRAVLLTMLGAPGVVLSTAGDGPGRECQFTVSTETWTERLHHTQSIAPDGEAALTVTLQSAEGTLQTFGTPSPADVGRRIP
jgi:hypothetical protein